MRRPARSPITPISRLVMAPLARLQEQILAHGSEMLVVLFPTKRRSICRCWATARPRWSPRSSPSSPGWRSLTSTDPAVKPAGRAGRLLFLEVDLHPNAEGYRLIAEVLLDHLQRNASDYGLTENEQARLR